jgi:hypothetical protein
MKMIVKADCVIAQSADLIACKKSENKWLGPHHVIKIAMGQVSKY